MSVSTAIGEAAPGLVLPENSATSGVSKALSGVTPEKVQQAASFAEGSDVLTAEQLASGLGLPVDHVKQNLLGGEDDTKTALSSNPALASIIKLMKMMFSMGVKVEKQSFDLIVAKLEAGNKSAEEAWQGAIAQFACDMVAGIVSAGIGVAAFSNSTANRSNKTYQPSMWLGPVGVQVVTGPLSSAGQFANAEGQLESQKMKNDSDALGEYLQQMEQYAQSLRNPGF